MSLIDNMMTPCCFVDKIRSPDGEGGFVTQWQDGAVFDAAITLDSSLAARIAEHDGLKNVYTITTRRNVTLEFHDVIRRLSDGKTFRTTSESYDKRSPAVSGLDMAQVSAEAWELTK